MKQEPYIQLVSELTEEERIADDLRQRRRRQKTVFGRICAIMARTLLAITVVVSALGYYAYRSAQRQPQFYTAALVKPPQDLAEAGQVFEQRVLDLQNSAHRSGKWETVFTADQVNGWIAVDLPRKFPQWLPRQVSDPRVSFEPDEIQFACRYEGRRFGGIVVAKADAFCTAESNQFAIRIHSVSAGIIPVPISQLANAISSGMRRARISMSWTEIDGDPVAIINLPTKITDVGDDRRVILEEVQIDHDRLILRGRTE